MFLKFLKKSLLIIIPAVIYCSIMGAVDSFNLFNSKLIPIEIKKKYAPLNYALWQIIDYNKNPVKNILIGDSRIGHLDCTAIEEAAHDQYYNFSLGGGNLQEIIDVFWFAESRIRLKNVYMSVNLEIYNKTNSRDRVEGAISIVSNPLLYFTNFNVLHAAYYDMKEYILTSAEKAAIGTPEMTINDFWNYQVNFAGTRLFSNYQYPDNYYFELSKISKYCKLHNILLTFLIMPNHTDIIKLISKFNLEKENNIFIKNLSTLGIVYNFNLINSLTKNKNNFTDPFHFKSTIADSIVSIVWKHSETKSNEFFTTNFRNQGH